MLRKSSYFNEHNIIFFQKKYELFKLLIEEIDIFIECFKEKRKIDRETFEHLCYFLIQVQDEFANEFGYIKFSEYISNNACDVVKYLILTLIEFRNDYKKI